MKQIDECKLLVIVGRWNRHVFTKEWIKKYLLPKEDFDFEVALALEGSHRISSNKIRIEFHNNNLSFIPRNNDIETYELITELATKIADYLPHTPVIGYGINFAFECNNDDNRYKLIKTNDLDELAGYGASILNSQLTHSFKLDNRLINLKIKINDDKLIFDYNFHSDISNFTEFKEKIYESPIKKLYETALAIMSEVYHIDE